MATVEFHYTEDEGDRLRCTVQVKGTRPVVSITRTESWHFESVLVTHL